MLSLLCILQIFSLFGSQFFSIDHSKWEASGKTLHLTSSQSFPKLKLCKSWMKFIYELVVGECGKKTAFALGN